jgi:hypothetical protein
MKKSNLNPSLERVAGFSNRNLTTTLSAIETQLKQKNRAIVATISKEAGWDVELLRAALDVKYAAARINDVVHSVGILVSLPKILKPGEKILSMSLGAGNTNRSWDLESDRRIAEFKFIRWQGGAETIRQNALFKDFFFLAEEKTERERYLYVLGLEHPMKFFGSSRKLDPILKGNSKLADAFRRANLRNCELVCDYFHLRENKVKIVDLIPMVPELGAIPI